MNITPFPDLLCPLDGLPLRHLDASWQCDNGHCFDIAAQGYANLLPVQKKRSRDPGDSKEMVAARRRFLDAGHYQPIAAAVTRLLLAELPADRRAACLDAGCGEGYYLRQLAAGGDEATRLALLGLDISKWAVMAAAKQDRRVAWVVGSNAALPVPDRSLDRILCMFGFPVYAEFARALKPGGQLLLVDAGPDHLRQLRAVIYPALKTERAEQAPVPAGFRALPDEYLRYATTVVGRQPLADLLAMTPHLYRASPEGRARAAALDELAITVDVRLRRLERGAA